MDHLGDLQALRLRLHRLDPPRPLRDVRAAVAFVRERKIVLTAGRSSLPMLAEAIAGHPIRGSWMADPEVFRIHRLMRLAHRSAELYAVHLIEGKETLVTASLGPAAQRIAADRSRRDAVIRQLSPPARKLLDVVESSGEVRMDRWSGPPQAGRAARLDLVREWLVVSSELHTEAGYHTALVRPWNTAAISSRFGKLAAKFRYDNACRRLWEAAVRSAVIVPEREALRWFPFGDAYLEDLIMTGRIIRVSHGRRVWLVHAAGPRLQALAPTLLARRGRAARSRTLRRPARRGR